MAANEKSDLYSHITNTIIAELERGVRPWARPWTIDKLSGPVCRPLRHNLQPYSGINVLLLWIEAANRGFSSPVWMTYRQAAALGGQVRKGESGSTVVYANRIVRTETGRDGQEVERRIPFLKAYSVFNLQQIDGLAALGDIPLADPNASERRIELAERFFGSTGVDIRHGGGAAYYSPSGDFVQVPLFEAFADPESYYATVAHECCHWTGHPARLDRDFGRTRWGDQGYAREELVAELGAAFLCADLGLELQPREDHSAYIASWLEVLAADRRFIVAAAGHAQRACEYLHGLQTEP